MREDPIIADVRHTRHEIERECDDDFHKIYQRALNIQKKQPKDRLFSSEAIENEVQEPVLSRR